MARKPYEPQPPDIKEHGGTDVKRTALDNPPKRDYSTLESRLEPQSLVEEQTLGSYFNVTGSNSILAKDPMGVLNVTVEDRRAPNNAEIKGHDPFKDAV